MYFQTYALYVVIVIIDDIVQKVTRIKALQLLLLADLEEPGHVNVLRLLEKRNYLLVRKVCFLALIIIRYRGRVRHHLIGLNRFEIFIIVSCLVLAVEVRLEAIDLLLQRMLWRCLHILNEFAAAVLHLPF